MRRLLFAALVSSVLFVFASVRAEPLAQADDIKGRLQAAAALYDTGADDEDGKVYVSECAKVFAEMIAKKGGKPTAEMIAAVQNIVAPDFANLLTERRQAYISAFANHFTLAEISELTAFYSTPLGQKIGKTRAALVADVYAKITPLVRSDNEDAWADHQTDYQKLGLSFHKSQ